MTEFYQFMNGMGMMGCWACGLFFFRFFRKSGDRLFLIFGMAFWVFSLERVILLFRSPLSLYAEATAPIYLLRLSAFLIIIFAIWDKNRAHRG